MTRAERPPGTAVTIPTQAALVAASGGPNVAQLTEIKKLALRQMTLEDEIAALNLRLEEKQRQLYRVKSEDIPTALKAAGVMSLKLEDGSVVEVTEHITANIKEENAPLAFAWLRKHKFGALIKTSVAVAFGMGEDKQAAKLIATLKKSKIPFAAKQAVHPMTLKAFVREQIEAGKVLPAAIDVHRVPATTIRRVKT